MVLAISPFSEHFALRRSRRARHRNCWQRETLFGGSRGRRTGGWFRSRWRGRRRRGIRSRRRCRARDRTGRAGGEGARSCHRRRHGFCRCYSSCLSRCGAFLWRGAGCRRAAGCRGSELVGRRLQRRRGRARRTGWPDSTGRRRGGRDRRNARRGRRRGRRCHNLWRQRWCCRRRQGIGHYAGTIAGNSQ